MKYLYLRFRECVRTLSALCALGFPALACAVPPTVQIAFAPTIIQTGTTSRLTITLGNANAGAATLTAALTDSLPAGLTIANPTALGGSCTAGALAANAGGRSVSYAADATIP